MSKLDETIERLDGAVDRLEHSLTVALSRGGNLEVLAAELEATKRDYTALASTTDAVSAKLDTAIGRLKFVLDS